ncbi:4'-phosphopantetheinyl transferase family protein [Chengkuizengella marina]|uniref:4'-phosphopantetheinyl transferase superfamily protein n=1 Tax=Chengkuizengella marina TaxID=2507566 RepID=A0A6N9Q4K6_9BACL|nr:4'-phosphopantetheinyl transferase superfamily protein [Chengkuizengella marina]NBI29785.1 4'-phosphopantetheinyl transferase superfamily protein [Chengkuizengella marina]
MEIIAVKVDSEIEHSLYIDLLKNLTKEKQNKLNKFRNKKDAYRSLLGEILIRTEIMNLTHIKNHEIVFEKNSYGKPKVMKIPQLHFNVSHSGDWVTCAIDRSIIGIDVELIASIDYGIADRFFSKQEVVDLLTKEEPQKLNYFFDLWTLKESYIKTDGRGLSIPLDSFSIRKTNEVIQLTTENPLKGVFFKQYEIDDLYKCSVCALNNQFPPIPRVQSLIDTCNIFLNHINRIH